MTEAPALPQLYLVRDWTNKQPGQVPTDRIVTALEVFEWLERIRLGPDKIAVYEIGRCLLDWS